jgi:hypothetical protein
MIFAGHLPTKHFLQAEWLEMPVFKSLGSRHRYEASFPEKTGFYRTDVRGKPVVFWFDLENLKGGYAVRPIVRVPMRRA